MEFLAVDIGASGGRHIAGRLDGGKIVTEEVYRFENSPVLKNGHLYWDTKRLFSEIIKGLKEANKGGIKPFSIGIDTWGVDYAIIDKNGNAKDVFCYRDGRTAQAVEKVHAVLPKEKLYAKTGIQFQPFNTVYQLYEDLRCGRLDDADCFLMLPDYFNYLLTGAKKQEYTNATTSGLVNAESAKWDNDIIKALGLPEKLFMPLSAPGTKAGIFTDEIVAEVGFNTKVVLPCTHDTASAVLAAPIDEKSLYISSGTWSLIGAELNKPITGDESRKANFTNEGGYGGTYRYLRNIMGLWIVQVLKKNLGDKYSFAEMVELSRGGSGYAETFDVNNGRFLSALDMRSEILDCLGSSGKPLPKTDGELIYCVYQSLAKAYADAADETEKLTGKSFSEIRIVGGGGKNAFLNELTQKLSGRKVAAGPYEATAIGNLSAQMIAAGEIANAAEIRRIIKNSL